VLLSNRFLLYKGKYVKFDKPIRKGICQRCGKSVDKGEINLTNLHHFRYDDSDPSSCHQYYDPKLRWIMKQTRKWKTIPKLKCPTCNCRTKFSSQGTAPKFVFHPMAGYTHERNYSTKEFNLHAFRCPTCGRGRLFSQKGSLPYNEYLKWKNIQKITKWKQKSHSLKHLA